MPLLQSITARSEESLQQALTHLQAAEFLYETGLVPEPHYTFKHVLTREVTYQSLLRRTCQQYHARIAQALEAQFPTVALAQPELLAQHYTEAGLRAQAVVYLQRAGQYAIEHSAYVEALAHLRQGLVLTATLPDTPERLQHDLTLSIALGMTLAVTQGYAAPEVEQAYLQARECCRKVGDPVPLFTVLRGLWLVYLVRAEVPRA